MSKDKKLKVIEKNGHKYLTQDGKRAGSLPDEQARQAPTAVESILSLVQPARANTATATSVELALEKFKTLNDPDLARGAEYAKNRIKLPKGITLSLPGVDFDYKDHPMSLAYPVGIVAQIHVEGSSEIVTIYKTEEDDPEDFRNKYDGKSFVTPNRNGTMPIDYEMGPSISHFQLHDSIVDGDLQVAIGNTEYVDAFGRVHDMKGSPENFLPDAIQFAIKIAEYNKNGGPDSKGSKYHPKRN